MGLFGKDNNPEAQPPERESRLDDKLYAIDLDSGAFITNDRKIIGYEGANYYRSCGVVVHVHTDESKTTCVKRLDHPSWVHEDYDGHTADSTSKNGQSLETNLRRLAFETLKRTGLDAEEAYNALNALECSGIVLSKEP